MKRILLTLLCVGIYGCGNPGSFKHDNMHDPLSADYQPYAVKEVTASIISNNEIRIDWKNNNNDMVKFQIERSEDPSSSQFHKIADVPFSGSTESYTDTLTLVGGTVYQYRIKVSKDTNTSSYVTSNSVTYVHKNPDSLKVQVISKTSVRFSWKPINNSGASYWVAYQVQGSNNPTIIKRGYQDSSIVITGLDTTKTYDLMVSSDDGSSETDNSKITISYTMGITQSRVIRKINSSYITGDFVYVDGGQRIAVVYTNNTIEFIDPSTGQVEKNVDLNPVYQGGNTRYYHMATNKDGSVIAASLPDQQVYVLTSQGQIIRSFNTASSSIYTAAPLISFTATGDTLIYETNDHKYLNLVNPHTGDFLTRIPINYNQYNSGLSISHSDKYFAVATGDSISLWQISPLKYISNGLAANNLDYNSISFVQFSPDDSKIYYSFYDGAYAELKSIDFSPINGLSNASRILVAADRPYPIYEPGAIATIPGNKYAVVSSTLYGSPDLFLLDTSTNTVLATSPPNPANNHADKVAYGNNGKDILCSFDDRIVDYSVVNTWFVKWVVNI